MVPDSVSRTRRCKRSLQLICYPKLVEKSLDFRCEVWDNLSMRSPNEYRAIRIWGENTGSYPYYIKAQQEKAAEENAPLNALYKDHNGKWQTVDDLPEIHWMRDAYKKA